MPTQRERLGGEPHVASQGLCEGVHKAWEDPSPCMPQKAGLQPESTLGPPACVPALHAHVWGTLQVGGRETCVAVQLSLSRAQVCR